MPSVFGLVWGSTATGTFPSPYDVREGVDNGNGELGTLTLPDVADVRYGIQFGGDGVQYTGTLFVPSAGAGYKANRLKAFTAELRTWPTSLKYRTTTYQVIASAQTREKILAPANFTIQRPAVFDMLESDYNTAQIKLRETVSIVWEGGSVEFEVYSIQNDPQEPFVRLNCFYKQ